MLGMPIGVLAQEAQPGAAGEPAAVEAAHAPEEAHAAEEHAGGIMETVARLINFSILAGTLVYLLRSPFAAYLIDRGTQIRSDLVNAAEMKRTAAAQIEEIDRKMAALPGELEALRLQGGRRSPRSRPESDRPPPPSAIDCWSRRAAKSTSRSRSPSASW